MALDRTKVEKLVADLYALMDRETPEGIVEGLAHLTFVKDTQFAGKEELYNSFFKAMVERLYLKVVVKRGV